VIKEISRGKRDPPGRKVTKEALCERRCLLPGAGEADAEGEVYSAEKDSLSSGASRAWGVTERRDKEKVSDGLEKGAFILHLRKRVFKEKDCAAL